MPTTDSVPATNRLLKQEIFIGQGRTTPSEKTFKHPVVCELSIQCRKTTACRNLLASKQQPEKCNWQRPAKHAEHYTNQDAFACCQCVVIVVLVR